MKKHRIAYFLLPIALLILVIGCNDDDEETTHDTQAVSLHLHAENAALDIYKQVQDVLKDTALHLLPENEKSIIELQKGCANIKFYSHDTLRYDSIIIEYGDGCTGINDYTRKGALTVLMDGKYTEASTNIIVQASSTYALNGEKISIGTFRISCQGSIDGKSVDSLIVDNFVVNSTASWSGDYKLTWTSGTGTEYPNVGDDIFELSGKSNAYNSDIEVNNEIAIPLSYSLNCKYIAQGVSELYASNLSSRVTIDYGNNGCNNLVSCTIDGKDYELTID